MPPPLNFPAMPAGLSVEAIAKVPSRYYRVPRYFFTVLTVTQDRWYRPTLARCCESEVEMTAGKRRQGSGRNSRINLGLFDFCKI